MRLAYVALAALIFVAGVPIGYAQPSNGEQLYKDSRAAMNQGDKASALKNLRASAEAGYVKAQGVLGHMYYVQKAYDEAFRWTHMAAEGGYRKAQTMLGNMYARGYGVGRDEKKAVEWTLRAAEGGDPVAQVGMAARYADGLGVPKDYVQTHKWLIIAWDQLPATNEAIAGNAIRIMKGTINKMTSEQRAAAEKLAASWLSK